MSAKERAIDNLGTTKVVTTLHVIVLLEKAEFWYGGRAREAPPTPEASLEVVCSGITAAFIPLSPEFITGTAAKEKSFREEPDSERTVATPPRR